ncbi:fasciclin domain-containing protein [Catalinimonas niigatensis]|uniref:fasciclin domain-containing protein n=1 Tax=Catalinimonas niigatensis TaxID=1397264 RepID=UPI002666F704|nr:fasciclin domain-containing protein [Catalinimonas niigatensis]WPP52094.1 fasciclin domain-containing protein [Catalinimonas niigatensis]
MKKPIFNFKRLLYTLGAFSLSLLFLASCSDDDDNGGTVDPSPTQNIVEIAQGDDRFETLVSALQSADLVSTLSGNGPFTVFAPTDDAFAALLESNDAIDDLSDISQESLVQILQYHVANGSVLSTDLSNGQTVNTLLSGETLSIGVTGDNVTVNGASVVQANVLATNGVIHAIDQVLVPEGFEIVLAPKTIAEIASETDALSILVAALQRSPDLLEAAGNEDADLTVFAPTDAAFVALLETLTTATGNTFEGPGDIPDYVVDRVLRYHILATSKTATELTESEETLEGSSLAIDGITINGSTNVVEGMADIPASNGVVHVIDAVLVPPFILNSLGTVLEPAVFDAEGRFTTLLAAVETAELDGALTDPDAMLTVFAPTNDAFAAYIEGSAFADAAALLASDILADVLLYHVIGATVPSADIAAGASSAPTLYNEGQEVFISNNGEAGIFLNGGPQVIIPDLEEDNGVVHVIDGVLVPPMSSIAEIVVAAASADEGAQFTLLLAALQNADATDGSLVDLLSAEGAYTVFAPTDQAFIDAGFADAAAIEAADPAVLRAVLLYHVVSAVVFSTDLSSGAVATAGGGEVTVNVADPVTITDGNADSADAEVIDVNILATNGVIHVINQVLLPE